MRHLLCVFGKKCLLRSTLQALPIEIKVSFVNKNYGCIYGLQFLLNKFLPFLYRLREIYVRTRCATLIFCLLSEKKKKWGCILWAKLCWIIFCNFFLALREIVRTILLLQKEMANCSTRKRFSFLILWWWFSVVYFRKSKFFDKCKVLLQQRKPMAQVSATNCSFGPLQVKAMIKDVINKFSDLAVWQDCVGHVRPQKPGPSSNFVFDNKFQLEDIIAERMQPELLPSIQCCHKKV